MMSSAEESQSKRIKLEEKEKKETQGDMKFVDSVDEGTEISQIGGEQIRQEINMADRRDLTDDIWLEVFKWTFPLKKRLRLILICKRWKYLVEKSLTNVTRLNFRDFFIQSKPPKFAVLRSILELVGHNLKSLELNGYTGDEEFPKLTEAEISLLIRTCPKLTELDLSRNDFYPAEVILLLEGRLTKVESFKLKCLKPRKIRETLETKKKLHRVVQSMSNLKHLSLYCSWFLDPTREFLINLPKSLESLDFGQTRVPCQSDENISNLEEFLRQHPNLKEIRQSNMAGGRALQQIPRLLAQFCPNVTKVQLTDSLYDGTSEERRIYSFLGDLHNLKELDVNRNFYFDSEAILSVSINCQQLEKLDISGTKLTSADLLNLGNFKNLKWLRVGSIEDLQLTDAVMMAILPQIGAKLEYLDVRQNEEISDSILTTLASECPNLSRLNITRYQPEFTTAQRLEKFLDKFTSKEDWQKQTWRELRISTELITAQINLKWYGGRVKIIGDLDRSWAIM